MKLTIDIGNTAITIGVFDNLTIIKKNNFKNYLKAVDFIKQQKTINFHSIIISSVVPDLSQKLHSELLEIFNIKPKYINYQLSQIICNVKHPETVGADRLCNIAASKKLYTSPTIIIDFGTATTYDIINQNGEFLGGIIAPGIETSANYLIKKAALLDKTELQFPSNVIGVDTKGNVQSGIMYGAIDQIEGMIKRIKNERPDNYTIILTGGFSQVLSSHLCIQHIVDIDLTLKGMIYIDRLYN